MNAETAKQIADRFNGTGNPTLDAIRRAIDKNASVGSYDVTYRAAHDQPTEDALVADRYAVAHADGLWTVDFSGVSAANPLASFAGLALDNLEDVTLTGDVNDYAPPNWCKRSGIRITNLNGEKREITGFAPPVPASSCLQLVVCVFIEKHIKLKHEDSESTTNARLSLPDGSGSVDLHESSATILKYDVLNSRWNLFELKQ